MKDDKILIAQVADKIRQCESQYVVTYTGFLDMHQKTLIFKEYGKTSLDCRLEFFGGYDDAERVIALFLPEYADLKTAHPLVIIRATKATGSKTLTHRDYLGSLLALGITRDLIGDIIVRDDGADIILLSDIADFILTHYDKAGHTPLSLELKDIGDLKLSVSQFKDITDTLASLRLDNVISSAFGVSRTKATSAIKSGLVFLNSLECSKPDKQVALGDKVVLRGNGKAYLLDIGGKSRKDRIYVTFRVYGR